ncbi:hypothetical protein LSH36_387g01053 [Paralvinella palmiformis]|uniref:Uncharacterized protein n=1 Tax=Paralvinella palmiformis TaxID=53620 RepID=A0AAD9N0R9_9ANNE|nr:hypothetical protein LSH36_387g01053 [Paralvinella palmiformis]
MISEIPHILSPYQDCSLVNNQWRKIVSEWLRDGGKSCQNGYGMAGNRVRMVTGWREIVSEWLRDGGKSCQNGYGMAVSKISLEPCIMESLKIIVIAGVRYFFMKRCYVRLCYISSTMETLYYTHNGSRRSRTSRQSQTSRGSRPEGCVCVCNRESGKNIVLVVSLVMVLGLTAALLVMGLSTHREYTTQEMEKEVKLQAMLFCELYNSGKYNELSQLYTTDAILMAPGGAPANGRTAIADYFKSKSLTTRKVTENQVKEVEIINDVTAFSSSEFTFTVNDVINGRKTVYDSKPKGRGFETPEQQCRPVASGSLSQKWEPHKT